MIIQETKSILEKHLGKDAVETIDNKVGIFKCTKIYNGDPYKIMYIDCSDKWLEKNFEAKQLEAYLEKYILKDYYSKSGPLQWNFYYAFISPKNIIEKAEAKKEFIEADDLYSRKYVWSPIELNQWLERLDNLSRTSTKTIEQDLSSIWISELQKQNLDVIYSAKSVEEGIRMYMSNEKYEVNKSSNASTKTLDDGMISQIKKLNLKKFRKRYKNETFDFGKVNLLTGSNGSGKTSLMEAMELLLCGSVYRNKGIESKGAEIEAVIDGISKPIKFSNGTVKLYKQRDLEWYNNPGQLFNRLDISFNKYNFYNTDAAYELANKKDGKSIKEAFEDIALGDGVNTLELSMNKYFERLKKEGNIYKKKCEELNKETEKEKKILNQLLTNDQNPEQFLAEIIEDAKKAKWSLAPTKTELTFKKNLVSSKVIISSIVNEIKWSNVTSRAELNSLAIKYAKALDELNKLDRIINDCENAEQKNTDELKLKNEKLRIVKQILPYYKVARIAELPGLKEKIKEAAEKVKALTVLQKIYFEITAEDIKSLPSANSLHRTDTLLNRNQRTLENIVKDLSFRQQNLMNALGQLDKVIKEIKAKGREYLQLNPTATDCPLCNSEYNAKDLVRRIETTKKSIQSSVQIDIQENDLKNKKEELKAISLQKMTIEKLKNAFDLLYDSGEYDRNPSVIWNTAGRRIVSLEKQKAYLDNLIKLEDNFNILDLNEETYIKMSVELDEIGIQIKTEAALNTLGKKINEEIKILGQEASEIKMKIMQSMEKKKYILSDLQLTIRSASLVVKRSISLSKAETNCVKLFELKPFKSTQKFSDINSEIETFKQLIDEYEVIAERKAENQLRLKTSNKKIEELQSNVKTFRALQERAESGWKGIEKLFSNHNKQSYLEHFVEANKQEILAIFRMIHTPSEFIDLGFDGKGDIILTREDQSTATLNEISTGQRSALSLSVFSALNRKLKKGPNLLLFDDPVANVDDLNVLSYFDYLREVAVAGNRQIFFATANENIAFLFSQKFSFLGDDFKTIPLKNNGIKNKKMIEV